MSFEIRDGIRYSRQSHYNPNDPHVSEYYHAGMFHYRCTPTLADGRAAARPSGGWLYVPDGHDAFLRLLAIWNDEWRDKGYFGQRVSYIYEEVP